PVKMREWIGPALASPDLVLDAQPPAQPHRRVVVERSIRLANGSYFEVVRPSAPNERFNFPTSCVVSCHVPVRTVSAWMLSTIRLMLFFEGRHPRYALPILAEYIRPNVYPRKSNSRSGTLQIRVFSSLTVSFSFPMSSRSRCKASSALPFRHRITRSSA